MGHELDEVLICRLRELATNGATTCDMILAIHAHLPDKLFNPLIMELYFMRAFVLPLRLVRELEGHKWLGGIPCEDHEMDEIILPQIAANRHLWAEE